MARKQKKLQIKTCLVCDVARKDVGNKDILIGIYSGPIVLPELPFTMMPFAVWIEIKPTKLHHENVLLEIVSPEGKPIAGGKGVVTVSDNTQYSGVPFQFPMITFLSAGTYTIRFGLDDIVEDIGTFEVKRGDFLAPK